MSFRKFMFIAATAIFIIAPVSLSMLLAEDHLGKSQSSVTGTISSGGVLPTVFPSSNTTVGAWRHGTYPSWDSRTHLGVDVLETDTVTGNEPVHAMAAGTVTDVISTSTDSKFNSLGYMVILRHKGIGVGGADVYSLSIHLAAKPLVTKDSNVTKGQQIGVMGRTGAANNIFHTHFEVRYFSGRFSSYGNIYGPQNCDLRNAGIPPESTDGDDCNAEDSTYFSNSWADPQTFTVPAPSAPSALQATDGTYRDRVHLTWSPVNRDDITYSVYRSTCTSCTKVTLSSSLSSTSFDDRSAAAGTTYYYFIKARSSDGISIYTPFEKGYRAR